MEDEEEGGREKKGMEEKVVGMLGMEGMFGKEIAGRGGRLSCGIEGRERMVSSKGGTFT